MTVQHLVSLLCVNVQGEEYPVCTGTTSRRTVCCIKSVITYNTQSTGDFLFWETLCGIHSPPILYFPIHLRRYVTFIVLMCRKKPTKQTEIFFLLEIKIAAALSQTCSISFVFVCLLLTFEQRIYILYIYYVLYVRNCLALTHILCLRCVQHTGKVVLFMCILYLSNVLFRLFCACVRVHAYVRVCFGFFFTPFIL